MVMGIGAGAAGGFLIRVRESTVPGDRSSDRDTHA